MRAVFTIVTLIFIVCVVVTVNSFAEVPLWKLESQPPKAHDFLNEDKEDGNQLANESLNADDMTKTTSYGTLSNSNEAPMERPRSVLCLTFINHFVYLSQRISFFFPYRMINVVIRCHHYQ